MKLKKLHVALGHGSSTAMTEWLKAGGRWHPEFKKSMEKLLLECLCKVSKEPLPHAKVSINTPKPNKQSAVSLDILYLEVVPVMHAVVKCIGLTETAVL